MRTAAVQPIQTFKRYTISSQTSSFGCYILFRNLISLHQQFKPSTPFASKKVDLRHSSQQQQGSLKCPHPSPFVQQEAAAKLQKLHICRHDNTHRPSTDHSIARPQLRLQSVFGLMGLYRPPLDTISCLYATLL